VNGQRKYFDFRTTTSLGMFDYKTEYKVDFEFWLQEVK